MQNQTSLIKLEKKKTPKFSENLEKVKICRALHMNKTINHSGVSQCNFPQKVKNKKQKLQRRKFHHNKFMYLYVVVHRH